MLQGASAFIKSTVIKENNASLAIGGAVACIGGQLNISTASSIMGNTCATLGGGLYLTQGCFAELSKNVTLIANSAGRQHHGRCLKKGSAGGGAVAIEPSDDASRPTALLIEDCVMHIYCIVESSSMIFILLDSIIAHISLYFGLRIFIYLPFRKQAMP